MARSRRTIWPFPIIYNGLAQAAPVLSLQSASVIPGLSFRYRDGFPLGGAPGCPFPFGQSRQVIFGHIVLLAKSSGGVLFATTGNLAYLATIDPLTFRGEPTIAPHLLVVPEAISFGNLGFTAPLYQTSPAPFLVFALGCQPAMTADLLIVTGTVPGRARFPAAALCFAYRPPLGLDNNPE